MSAVAELNPGSMSLQRDQKGRLVLKVGDEERLVLRVIRSFPLTSPNGFVSLWGEDGEIGLIPNLEALDSSSRTVIGQELEKAYFMPKIRKILRVKELYGGITEFAVETDKGFREFEIQSKNQIRHVGVSRVLITDVDGNKYEIPDVTRLDSRSRSLYGWVA